MVLLKRSVDDEMRRMSWTSDRWRTRSDCQCSSIQGSYMYVLTLKTPARVRTSPDEAPMRKTAATLSENAIDALAARISGPTRMMA